MTIEDTALPVQGQPAPEASGQPNADQLNQEADAFKDDAGQPEGEEGKQEDKAKAEKTPEERERQRMQRGIDRRTRQLAEARAELAQLQQQLALTKQSSPNNNSSSDSDSEPLQLTRKELEELISAKAKELAPQINKQDAEVERRKSVVQSLESTWGREKFDALSSDLDDALGGLRDRSGQIKPVTEAIFEAENPTKLIEYLADPDNADEAERIGRMSSIQAIKAIDRLEAKLKSAPAKDKPQPSKVPAPLESVRGQGSTSSAPDPSNTKAWIAWRNEQERKGLL